MGTPPEPRAADVAVVGMSGRFPGSPDLAAFWQNLRSGVESISTFSDEELLASGVAPELFHDPAYVRARGTIEDVELFDAAFFGISPREAELIDPQQRLFLECAWEAVENAGYDPESVAGPVGVFASSSRTTYRPAGAASDELLRLLATERDFLATRVSYKLNLKGPSVNVQSACSSSLVALHLACQSLLAGECDLALAGGVSILVPQKVGYLYHEGGISSPDGHCRAFDARARGTLGGCGVGVVVVKRLAEAVDDGDLVRAVVRGSAVNNDGAGKVGFTAPSVAGQAAAIEEALAVAGAEPETVGYVEAHGTATPLGDPVEVAALKDAFEGASGRRHRVPYCALGSVKTNIGHLDAAAGVAGLIKTVLALEHREIPPTLHFESPHPDLGLESGPFFVNGALRSWPRGETPRRAGVSSYGIGGTNVHVVLEEAPARPLPADSDSRSHHLLVLSARTPAALANATSRLVDHFERSSPEEIGLADVAFTLQVGRRAFAHRRILVASDAGDAVRGLRSGDPARLFERQRARQPSVVFLFPGQGAQHPHMAGGLRDREPVFRRELDRCLGILESHLEHDLARLLEPAPGSEARAAEQLRQTSAAQPALFAVEYALAKLWMDWGVAPEALIGHSVGELVAACLAGVFRLEDALALVALRGRLIGELPAGAMLSLPLPAGELEPRLGGELALAAVNAPDRSVVSGSAEAIGALAEELAREGVRARRLEVSHAFHSPRIDPVLDPFREAVAGVERRAPSLPFVSNVTGTWITDAEATDPDYWARHLRSTVRFAEGVARLLEKEERILLEVGPGRTLTSLARRQPASSSAAAVLPSLPDPASETGACLLTPLGRLWLAGVGVDWHGFHRHERRRRVELPTYPFERERYWSRGPGEETGTARSEGKRPDPADWFYVPSWRPSVLAAESRPADGSWLVLAEEGSPGAALAERLEASGRDVVRVRAGSSFSKLDDGTYTLDPRSADGYRSLFEALGAGAGLPRTVVHTWSLGRRGATFEETVDRGFHSLLFLVRAFGTASFELVTVCDAAQEVTGTEELDPARATLLGPCRVIPQEYPEIPCRAIDVEVPPVPGWRERLLVDQLFRELTSEGGEPEIAYRGRQRFSRRFEPVRLAAAESVPRLRRRGVYLVTGGLGRVGLALSRYLARKVEARLILTGRSARRTPALRELEELGARVLAVEADAGDPEAMRLAIGQGEERFGPLSGVVHAAGFTAGEGFAAVPETTPALAAKHFHPKAGGLFVLDRLLGARELDFVLLTSSISAQLGGLGYAAYAAANLFMDLFARSKNRSGPTPWLSVDWDGWTFGERGRHEGFGAGLEELALSPEEGREALERILAADGLVQVVVSTGDLESRLERWTRRACPEPSREASEPPLHPRPDLDTPFVEPRTETERRLVLIWEEVLGLRGLGVHDDFFDLGGDSLLATQVLARLRRLFEQELSLRRFFGAVTVAELAQALEASDEEKAPEVLRAAEIGEFEEGSL